MAVPSLLLAGAPLIVAVGATLLTATVLVSLPTPPSSSVTVSVTTYEPLSSGVKLKLDVLPEASALPFLVTDQAYVNVSAVPGSVTELVRLIGVPSLLLAGAPTMAAVGLTLLTATVLASVPTPPSSSVTVSVTTYEPLSSGVKLKALELPVAYGLPFLVTPHW